MKRIILGLTFLFLFTPAVGTAADPLRPIPVSATHQVLSVSSFLKIKEFVLASGDRMTYSNRYNSNPHYAFTMADVFLDPDTGQDNINCDITKSDFNDMVIRAKNDRHFYRVRLSKNETNQAVLLLLVDTKEAELGPIFSALVEEVAKKK